MSAPVTTPEVIAASALGRVPALVIELEDVRAGYTVGPATISTAIEPVGGGESGEDGHDPTLRALDAGHHVNRTADDFTSVYGEGATP